MREKILFGLMLSVFFNVVLADVSSSFSEKIVELSIDTKHGNLIDEIIQLKKPVKPDVMDVTEVLNKYFEINMSKEEVLMTLKKEGFSDEDIKPWSEQNTLIATYSYGLQGKTIFLLRI